MRTIVISDIHIGDNYKTCWYQRAVHEPYMLQLLDYILANANKGNDPIGRLVILGDLFDFWTYPPSMVPPTVKDIVAANPNVFGPGAKLAQVVDALKGNVQYLRGNHDITITQNDLDQIPTGNHKIQLLPDVYRDPSGVVFTHGHLATMFNAPDPRYPDDVPVGHFVTRAISYMVDKTLLPGQTAADLPDQGSPYGFSLSSLIPGLADFLFNPSITGFLLDYICKRCGFPEDQPIKMANGQTLTIAQAKAKYDGLFTLWANQNGGGSVGAQIAGKAAFADYNGRYMAWFAQRFAFSNKSRSILMGHTHVPKVGIEGSWCEYVNTGFECPSKPDVASGKTRWNFGVIDGNGGMQLMQVLQGQGNYTVQPANAPKDQVVYSPNMDYSCYVSITNNGRSDMVLVSQNAKQGHFVVPPPSKIAVNETAEIWIQDDAGIHGSDGDAHYTGSNSHFSFSCPTGIFSNTASGGAYLVAGSTNPPTPATPHNQVPHGGHPLFVEFFPNPGAPLAEQEAVA